MWEDEAWLNCHNEDLWIFDKLILAKKLGYVCGPIGVDVPEPGYYIVRPCVNIMGRVLVQQLLGLKEKQMY